MAEESEQLAVIFLGTGTSHGVPMIGCHCAVCTSDDPHDKRTRPSIAVRFGGRTVLVDTTPELRLQCLANRIDRVDAVLYTHAHADHVTGLDDLRRFNWLPREESSRATRCDQHGRRKPASGTPDDKSDERTCPHRTHEPTSVDCYATAATLASIRRMFAYVFDDDPQYPSEKPRLNLHTIDSTPFEILGHRIVPVPLMHGSLEVMGFRFGDVAYCTDCNVIPASSMALLGGLDVLILDGLRKRPHPTHFNLEQAVEMARRIGAKRTFFTHIAHELGHVETNRMLPEAMALAYDGQVIDQGGVCGGLSEPRP